MDITLGLKKENKMLEVFDILGMLSILTTLIVMVGSFWILYKLYDFDGKEGRK